ncbi:MAG TPA: FAD-dependent oxidoreductase [Streptosporangiaceae bacterium]
MNSSEPVVVIGGGVTGMAAAMMLAKRGVPVVLVERDPRDAFGRAEEYPPLRPGAPHYNRPHNLRAGGRDVLLRSLPEVAKEVYALGARDAVEWPGSPRAEHLTVLVFRRSLLERALLSCARSLPALNLRFGERVLDLTVTGGSKARITGVVTTAGPIPARLVIDASGIRSTVLGRFGPPRVRLRSGLYYTSQPFLLSGRGFTNTREAAAVWIKPPSDAVAHARLFLHDRPHASVLVALHARKDPPGRELVRQTYEAILTDSDLRQYVSGAVPLSPVQTIGFLGSRLGLLDAQPLTADGIHQIGDALVAVDPLTSKGASLGLIQAEILANAIAADSTNHDAQRDAVLGAYREWVVPHWADGLLRGFYLGRNAELPPAWGKYVDAARHRGRQAHDILTAWRQSPAAHQDLADQVTRISQLQVPASAMEGLSHG